MEKSCREITSYQGPSDIANIRFSFPQANVLWEQLKNCWAREIFIPALTDSFFKLSLQLIARYSSWVIAGLNVESNENGQSIWMQNIKDEDHVIIFYQDLDILGRCLPTSYVAIVKELQPSLDPQVFEVLRESYSNLTCLLAAKNALGGIICERITQKCLVSLQQVKGIMQTYRMTNKAPSSHPSFYVQNIFTHLHNFLATNTLQNISQSAKQDWIHKVATDVTTKYAEWAVDMLQTAQKQNTILKKFIKTAKEPETGTVALKVDEKIAVQLSLDVAAYGEQLKALNISIDEFEPFQQLLGCSKIVFPCPRRYCLKAVTLDILLPLFE